MGHREGFAIAALGWIGACLLGLDFTTAVSSVAACIGNIGPGLGDVGPTDNFAWIPTAGKWVLALNMLLGRLEVYTILVLFVRSCGGASAERDPEAAAVESLLEQALLGYSR